MTSRGSQEYRTLSMAIPAAVAIIGIAILGRAMGMTRMDLLDLLGSVMVTPGSTASRAIGAVIHHVNGALLAIAWAYGVALVGLPANWLTAVGWGVVL